MKHPEQTLVNHYTYYKVLVPVLLFPFGDKTLAVSSAGPEPVILLTSTSYMTKITGMPCQPCLPFQNTKGRHSKWPATFHVLEWRVTWGCLFYSLS